MAGVLALSAPASAHAALLSGSTVCSDGSHVVTWSIGNDWPTPMTITSANATMNNQSYAVVGYTSPVYQGSPTSAMSTVPGSTGAVTLTVHSSWPDGVTHTRSTTVDLIHDCGGGSTTTTAAPTTLPPTTTAPSTTIAPATTLAPTTTMAPTTTAAPTTTTTAPPTTTTTEAPTTTAAPTTTTEAPTTTTEAGSTTTTIEVGGITTTLPSSTTTTVAPSTTEAPTTTEAGPTTTDTPVTNQGSTIATTTTTLAVPLTQQAVTTIPAGGTSLPRTGSSPTLPVVFGGGCLAAGAVLALRKRKSWTRP